MNQHPAIILDNGSFEIKVGTSDDYPPPSRCLSVIGRPKQKVFGRGNKDYYVGQETQSHRFPRNYPIPQQGTVNNWLDMEHIWFHVFHNELGIDPKEHRILMSESPFNSRENREQTLQIMFEKFNVGSMAGVLESVLALSAAGRTSGVVLESGDSVSYSMPVIEGCAMVDAISRVDFAGRHVMRFLGNTLLREYLDNNFGVDSERYLTDQIKESFCYTALDYEKELKKEGASISYELPDGNIISIGSECFKCTEILFQPHLAGMDCCGFQEMIFNSIRMCDIDVRKTLFSNIVLSGGSTLFKGTSERLSKELKEMVPSSVNISVIAPIERKFLAWIGGNILSSLSTFQSNWITKESYQEIGNSIIDRIWSTSIHDLSWVSLMKQ